MSGSACCGSTTLVDSAVRGAGAVVELARYESGRAVAFAADARARGATCCLGPPPPTKRSRRPGTWRSASKRRLHRRPEPRRCRRGDLSAWLVGRGLAKEFPGAATRGSRNRTPQEVAVITDRTAVLREVLDGFNRHDLDSTCRTSKRSAWLEAPADMTGGTSVCREGGGATRLAARFEGIPDVHYGEDDFCLREPRCVRVDDQRYDHGRDVHRCADAIFDVWRGRRDRPQGQLLEDSGDVISALRGGLAARRLTGLFAALIRAAA